MQRGGRLIVCLCLGGLVTAATQGHADEAALRQRAQEGLRRATDCFRRQIATEGGYLWRYSDDLSRREGERPATATMVWVQPPGTPSVGMVYLDAFHATDDPYYRDAARETAMALVNGQLRSGGWDYHIEFDPALRPRYAYRVNPGPPGKQNTTTLDDNTTQEALRLLMRVDQTLDFGDRPIHEAAEYALDRLMEVQYPIGAWPQRFSGPSDPALYPVKSASYPESWSRTFPGVDYKGFYTLNDNAMGDMIDVMLDASRIYKDRSAKYRASAERGGDFLLKAQMPDPQPAWAQQYDRDMHPAWARKFEPPAVTGGESQSAMRILMDLYRNTGESKYLEPIPRALAYLKASRLPDGRLARFYELKTNTPLYFTKDYALTYSDADVPTHYSFKVSSDLDRIGRQYEQLRARGPDQQGTQRPARPRRPASAEQVERVLKALDARGRWTAPGRLRTQPADQPSTTIIDAATFARNAELLIGYLAATKP